MPVVIAKPKTVLPGSEPKPVAVEAAYDDSDLAADVLTLYNSPEAALKEKFDAAKAALDAKKAEFDEIRKRVSEYIAKQNGLGPTDKISVVVNGKNVDVGALTASRKITDLAAIREKLGDELFMQLASIKLGDLDKYMTEPERKKVTTVEYVGERKVKVT